MLDLDSSAPSYVNIALGQNAVPPWGGRGRTVYGSDGSYSEALQGRTL